MTSESNLQRPAIILLVEDNDDDVELMRLGLKRSGFTVELHRVSEGEECMAFLRKQGIYAKAPTPDLILLDLNMPKMTGKQVMTELVGDASLRHLPVLILTTSDDEQEIRRMYALRCNSYIVKPIGIEQLMHIIRGIIDYWFGVVVLPIKNKPGMVVSSS